MPSPGKRTTLEHDPRDWFADRVRALLPELYGRARRLCRTEANAEDLVAESIAGAWEALDRLEDPSAFRAWIFRILNNRFVSDRRRARSRVEHEPLDEGDDDFSLFEKLHQPFLLWRANPEVRFLNRLLREDLEQSLDRVPEPYREAVVLVDVQGLGYREAADLLGIPLGTVRSRLARGRARLQELLWEHGRDAGLARGRSPTSNPTEAEA
jgi:RNA polymerase sigma-70 factor, ECF subfamily